jgi:DNA-binding LacI/PurR family transcriptional regulator
LPSVRRLATKFKLSFGTAYRAIHTLIERGLLEQRGTSGLFIKSRRVSPDGGAGRVAVILGPALSVTTGLFHAAFLGIESAAARAGLQLEIHHVALDKLNADKLRSIAAVTDGILLFGEYDAYLREFPVLPCPVVALQFASSWNGMISTVNIDIYDMAVTAAQYFSELDRVLRKITVYSSPKPIFVARAQAFESRWRSLGGRCEIQLGYPQDIAAYEKDCGFFFTSDHWLQNAAADYRQAHGTALTDDFVVLGVDGKQFLDPDFFRFPTISVDWRRMGEITFAELRRRMAEPEAGARCISICGKLCRI